MAKSSGTTIRFAGSLRITGFAAGIPERKPGPGVVLGEARRLLGGVGLVGDDGPRLAEFRIGELRSR